MVLSIEAMMQSREKESSVLGLCFLLQIFPQAKTMDLVTALWFISWLFQCCGRSQWPHFLLKVRKGHRTLN